jgi:hypothetical protein
MELENIDTVSEEATRIVSALHSAFTERVDGRDAITEMKQTGSSNWRQMEWMGFYFEEKAISELGISQGPTIDRTVFDAEANYVWDFKTHPKRTSSGNKRYKIHLNDAYSTKECVKRSGVGYVIAYVDPHYDNEERDFYLWHQSLKGGDSSYTKKRKERGATSRVRKRAFDFEKISAYYIEDLDALEKAQDDGWIKLSGQGRNFNGNDRNDKFYMKPHKIPEHEAVAEVYF